MMGMVLVLAWALARSFVLMGVGDHFAGSPQMDIWTMIMR
jgi:hypothetical protein